MLTDVVPHQEGQRDRPDEAPATIPHPVAGHRCQFRPVTKVRGEDERKACAVTTVLDRPASFGAAANLTCRECGATYDLGPGNACEQCFGPLEVGYDASLLASVTRESIES